MAYSKTEITRRINHHSHSFRAVAEAINRLEAAMRFMADITLPAKDLEKFDRILNGEEEVKDAAETG